MYISLKENVVLFPQKRYKKIVNFLWNYSIESKKLCQLFKYFQKCSFLITENTIFSKILGTHIMKGKKWNFLLMVHVLLYAFQYVLHFTQLVWRDSLDVATCVTILDFSLCYFTFNSQKKAEKLNTLFFGVFVDFCDFNRKFARFCLIFQFCFWHIWPLLNILLMQHSNGFKTYSYLW